jgi:CelD/BcsL family acetyltransferase involved in cellulose biosynthesis
LSLPATWDEFRAGLGRNIKESLRKCYNSLKRDNHAFDFRVLSSPADVAAGVERFFELHTARASLEGTVDHRDVFGHHQSQSFLRLCARAAGEAGELRVFQLVIADKVVATRLGFLLGKQLYLYFSGFDPAWAPYSVMTTTVAESIKWAIEQKLELVNLSPGRDVSKTRWGPQEMLLHEAYLPSQSIRGKLVHHAYREMRDENSRLARLLTFARRH